MKQKVEKSKLECLDKANRSTLIAVCIWICMFMYTNLVGNDARYFPVPFESLHLLFHPGLQTLLERLQLGTQSFPQEIESID